MEKMTSREWSSHSWEGMLFSPKQDSIMSSGYISSLLLFGPTENGLDFSLALWVLASRTMEERPPASES
jgi:hypothetical protein